MDVQGTFFYVLELRQLNGYQNLDGGYVNEPQINDHCLAFVRSCVPCGT